MADEMNFMPERRRHGRTRLQMQLKGIRLDPDGGEVLDTLRMTDISRSGLGAYSSRSLYPGQRMVVCLPLSGHGGRRNVYATVIRCREEHVGFKVGLEFDVSSVGAWCGVSGVTAAA